MPTEYQADTYGQQIAGIYDDLYADVNPDMIDLLAELARGGPALELGIGTGRVALPLQARGIELFGIEAAPAMVAKLRQKPGGESIPIAIGDFSQTTLKTAFNLIYVVFNTFFALLEQEAQIACFQNAARQLSRQGLFVIEAFVPDPARFTDDQTSRVVGIDLDSVRLDVTQHDPVNQQVVSQHILISEAGIKLYPVKLRYAWPSELDLMARLAGLRRQARWGSWQRAPFTSSSRTHISVYEKVGV